MRVLVTGAGGFLGNRLVEALLKKGSLRLSGSAEQEIREIVCADIQYDEEYSSHKMVRQMIGDLAEPEFTKSILAEDVDVVFHLAAIVSGEAEKNFELGRQINLWATERLLEQCRKNTKIPTFVFASSCAVFGGDFGNVVTDYTRTTPQSSYGTQKALGELMVNDYSRRNYVDGRSLRLPTICIRPGSANAATTSFVSGIIREPLAGRIQNCPVDRDTKVWILSPSRVVEHFIHAAQLPKNQMGDNRLINLPGITVTIGEMVDALEKTAGNKVIDYITWDQDDFLQSIVLTFPHTFTTDRAIQLGFEPNRDFDEILLEYLSEINFQRATT